MAFLHLPYNYFLTFTYMLITKEISSDRAKFVHSWLTISVPFEELNVNDLLSIAKQIVYAKKWDWKDTRKTLNDLINWDITSL